MKKTLSIISIGLLILISFFSCKKITDTVNNTTTHKLAKILLLDSGSNNYLHGKIEFTYDSLERCKSITYISISFAHNSKQTFYYNGNSRNPSFYIPEQIGPPPYNNKYDTFFLKYDAENYIVKDSQIVSNFPMAIVNEYTVAGNIVYGNKRIYDLINSSTVPLTPGYPATVFTQQISGGNILSQNCINNHDIGGPDSTRAELRYTYDNKIHPLFESSPLRYRISHDYIYTYIDYEFLYYANNNFNTNNIKTAEQKIFYPALSNTIFSTYYVSYNYTYDIDGYPIAARATGNPSLEPYRYEFHYY